MSCEDINVDLIPGKGKGIIALKRFTEGQIIEQTPVIVLPDPQWKVLEKTKLKDYYIYWDENNSAVPLGVSVFYNHSENANALFIRHTVEGILDIIAMRDIEANEEITVTYHCPPWFEVVS